MIPENSFNTFTVFQSHHWKGSWNCWAAADEVLCHSSLTEGHVSHWVRHLCVDLGSDAGRHYIQVDVVLLVQTQVAVTHQVQSVDTPETRIYMDQQLEHRSWYKSLKENVLDIVGRIVVSLRSCKITKPFVFKADNVLYTCKVKDHAHATLSQVQITGITGCQCCCYGDLWQQVSGTAVICSFCLAPCLFKTLRHTIFNFFQL